MSSLVSRRPAVRAICFLAAAVLVAGCFTGERPHFREGQELAPGSLTGDAAIDAVLAKFDAVTTGPIAAAYNTLTKYGNVSRVANVQINGMDRSVAIGNVHYIHTDVVDVTCTTDGSQPCVTGWDPARVSDTLLTADFYAAEPARRLRRDAAAALGPATGSVETIAQSQATCATLQLPGGVAKYCVLDSGMLALLDDGDVRVELGLVVAMIDPAQFVPPA